MIGWGSFMRHGRGTRCRAFFLIAVALVSPMAVSAESAWRVLENPWFRSLTNTNVERARELIEELDRFRVGVQKIADVRLPTGAAPTLVVIFDTAREFHEYSWARDIGGYTLLSAEGLPELTIVLPARGTNSDEFHTIRHEYVHTLNRYRAVQFPRWYEEGIAEVLSLMEIRGADITVGLLPKERFETMAYAKRSGLRVWRSFDDIVSGDLLAHDRSGFAHYAQYWLLAHYLTFGRPDLRQDLDRCLVLSDGMMKPLDAFRNAFGMTPEEMWDGEMRQYLWNVPARRFRLKSPIVAEPFRVKPADTAEVQVTLSAIRAYVEKRE
ncbi:MAG: hypothetical protein IT486_03460 [Gammaproteobacteria bacterium]|nr:hypothetical protein [Gammaproteobacteria bacterium]